MRLLKIGFIVLLFTAITACDNSSSSGGNDQATSVDDTVRGIETSTSLVLKIESDGSQANIRWRAVNGADSYIIDIVSNTGDQQTETLSGNNYRLAYLSADSYTVSVTALDANQDIIVSSPKTYFRADSLSSDRMNSDLAK